MVPPLSNVGNHRPRPSRVDSKMSGLKKNRQPVESLGHENARTKKKGTTVAEDDIEYFLVLDGNIVGATPQIYRRLTP